jgi:hypothetical protein
MPDAYAANVSSSELPIVAAPGADERLRLTTRPAGFEPATSRSGGERSIH